MAITPPSVSVVIAARNEQPAILDATLRGLLETCRDHLREIIIVDDASRIPIRSAYPPVRVQRNAFPLGVDRARRLGCALAEGQMLVIMDAHMTFNPDWLDRMLEHAEPTSLLCAAWMDYARKHTHCWGADLVWRNGFEFSQRTRRPAAEAVEVALVVGACYMLHRRAYEVLGGFSPVFHVWGMSEQDISIRAWMAGLKVKCVTRAGVGHLDRDTNPNPVFREHVIYNHLALIRTVFEQTTVPLLEDLIAPLPPQVMRWLEQRDVTAWRSEVQSRRKWSDARFFERFVAKSPLHFGASVRIKRGRLQVGKLMSAATQEEISLTRHLRREGIMPEVDVKPNGPSRDNLQGRRSTRPADITLQAFGVRMRLRVDEAAWLRRLRASLPWSWEPCSPSPVDAAYTLTREVLHDGTEAGEYYALYAGPKRLTISAEFDDVPNALQSSMESALAKGAKALVFVQAGVVSWKRRAIVIVGDTFTGTRALVTALVRAGADYYSDKFAIFDAKGQVHPYAKPLQLVDSQEARTVRWPIAALGSRVGSGGIPVGLIAILQYQPGCTWHPRRLSAPAALTLLLHHAPNRRQKSEMAFRVLGKIAGSTVTLKGSRGNADATAWRLLKRLDNQRTIGL